MASATNSKLSRFIQATSIVYGPVSDLPPLTAASWTPLTSPGAGGHAGRYLWTDAFGLVNFITLHRETGDPAYLVLARRLVQAVHETLGRERCNGHGVRPSRLPRATDAEPLAGGLRIGKEREDEDGAYHHYLTLWMFALDRLAIALDGEEGEKYSRLAVQLARAIHPHFVLGRKEGALRMVWKVSMDMSTVLVPSEGHLDAATGFVVYQLLQRTAVERFGWAGKGGDSAKPLAAEIEDYRRLMSREGKLSVSKDPLDLGMGLWMCHLSRGEEWATRLGEEALRKAEVMLGPKGVMALDPNHRLAFREFGTCIGAQCYGANKELAARVDEVVGFWQKYLEESTDEDLRPISLVMYAAALIPGGTLRVHVPLSSLRFNLGFANCEPSSVQGWISRREMSRLGD